jgi:diguanylate cyclase (GGDEF)-like protein
METLTSRIGGDEFLQLIPGISSTDEAAAFASSILHEFNNQPDLKGYVSDYGLGLSLGVSLYPESSKDYDDLIKYADIAMYHAKQAGKNNYKIYDVSMGDHIEGVELNVRKKARA